MLTDTQPIVLITGGAQRIGLALAEHFLAQQQPVWITYRTRHPAVETLEAKGAKAIFADFASDAGIQNFIQTILQCKPSIRALIHNASSWDCEAQCEDFTDLFQRMQRIHAQAPYEINLALEPLLRQHEQPKDIIHITDYVIQRGSPKHIAYAASKAALDNLTASFAAKFAPAIKVNSIAPSLIMFNEDDDEHYRAKTLKKSLLGIEPGAHCVVQSVQHCLSNPYLTGQRIILDGGRSLKN